MFDKLRELGLYDDTLVILTGDHGEGLGEHGEGKHGFFLYESTLHVPLLVRVPKGGLPGAQIDENVSLVDIVPTVLGLLGLPVPRQVEGMNLSGYLAGTAPSANSRAVYSESWSPEIYGCNRLYAIREGAWKYVQSRKPELYDLSRDAGEKVNVVATEAEIACRLRRRLEGWEKTMGAAASVRSGVPVARTPLQWLESLGYVGTGAVRGPAGTNPATEDPKDFAPILDRCRTAQRLIASRRYEEAKKELLDIVAHRPRFAVARVWLAATYYNLGVAADARGELDKAVASYKKAIEIEPHYVAALNNLGHTLLLLGEMEEGLRQCEEALEVDPHLWLAHYNVGNVYFVAANSRGRSSSIAERWRVSRDRPGLTTISASLWPRRARRRRRSRSIAAPWNWRRRKTSSPWPGP